MTTQRFDNKGKSLFPEGVAVVIGGSGGIGQAICVKLAEHGTSVALTYRRNAPAGEATAAMVRDAGQRAHAARLDLTDGPGTVAFFADVLTRFERVHSVVFAAGADISMPYVAEIDAQEWRSVIDGDLNGFFNVAKAAIPLLRKGGGGSLTAITSAGLVRHPPRDILSTVPKAGIEAMIRGLAREEGRYGIRANAVAPGVIDTGLFHRLEAQLSKDFVEAMRRNTALRRFGSAEDVANAALFLASSSADYITGQSLTVDGGFSV